jgi:hypothetical protein
LRSTLKHTHSPEFMTQNHFAIAFPLRSPAHAKMIEEQLPALMPQFFQSQDSMARIHYSQFTLLSEKTLLFLADFDGDFGQLMTDFSRHAGEVFDFIFRHVQNPPPTPVIDHADSFALWMKRAHLRPLNLYSGYPNRTVKDIKRLALNAGVKGSGEQRPFFVLLPTKSGFSFFMTQALLLARGKGTTKDLNKMGTPHFAQFVPLENKQIGFFTTYDGTFDTYIRDFTKCMGEFFDLLFKFTRGAPPTPCRKHLIEFIDFAAGANKAPMGFYSAYPGLTVEDIHVLITEAKASTG